jgi:hypothetical protein
LFFENAILVSIWRHVWTRFFKKKKKRTDPFTSSFSHTKNIIYDS